MLMAGDLDMGHARALLALEPAQQILNANEIAAKKLSVRDAEKLVARNQAAARASAGAGAKPRKEKSGDIARLEEQLADKLAAAVEIRLLKKTRHGESGEVAISFASLDELNGLLERLGLGEEA
jgi:ParB family chromosome partitioning protein